MPTCRVAHGSILLSLIVCLSFLASSPSTHVLRVSESEVTPVRFNQRTVSISKLTSPSAAQAILKAEQKNPGWKVVRCKELSQSWLLTLKKPQVLGHVRLP
ncbi:MAG: hypothetical protein MK108_15815 [Mariniblastus sp.]|nr:hypothetical protein [Mariniblastus sp.]